MGLPATRGYRGNYGQYKRYAKERKALDTRGNPNIDNVPSVGAGTIILCNGIAQGDDYYNRIGRQVLIKSIYLRIAIINNQTTFNSSQVRWMLLWDSQSNNANITFPDVVGYADSAATQMDSTQPNNLSNRDRFKIIYDKVVNVNATASGEFSFAFNKKFKNCNVKTTYSGTGNTIAAVQTNALWLIASSYYPAASVNLPQFAYNCRIRYEDC